ncbi:hypothetical protein GEMRC1_012980 [Eukaryota sp. GEM-RC1]
MTEIEDLFLRNRPKIWLLHSELAQAGITDQSINILIDEQLLIKNYITELDQYIYSFYHHPATMDREQLNQLGEDCLALQNELAEKSNDFCVDEKLKELTPTLKELKVELFRIIKTKFQKPKANVQDSNLSKQKHSLMHDYNDIRDFVLHHLNQLANKRGVTVKSLYEEFEIPFES